jgi:hypothetical protein
MTDPKRWLEEPPFAGAMAERLILAGRRIELPPQAVERCWAEFSAGIAAGGAVVAYAAEAAGSATATGVSAAGAGGAAVGLSSAALVKSFVVGAVLGVGAASAVPAVRYVTRPAPTVDVKVAALPASSVSTRSSAASSGSPGLAATALPSAPAAPEPAAPYRIVSPPALTAALPAPVFTAPTVSSPSESPPVLPDANRLKLEALELAKAKNLLETGDTGGALGILRESRVRFANGAMVEERDALMIEALVKRGDAALAQDAARRFVVRFPKSPLAERVKRTSGLE